MFNRDLVQSGFDVEMLVSEQYLSYLLLSQVEAGTFNLVQTYNGTEIKIHPPGAENYRTSYRDGDSDRLPDPIKQDTFKVELLPGDPGEVRSLAFTDANKVLLVHTHDGQVRGWDYEDYSVVPDYGFEVPSSYCSAFDSTASTLAVAVYPHSIELWDVASKARSHTLTGHSLAVLAVGFSGNGERLVSGSLDGSVRVWNVTDGTSVVVFEQHSEPVNAAKLSLNGLQAVSGDEAGVIHLWEVESGNVLRTFDLGQLVVSVALSIGGSHVAAAGRDGVIKYWSVSTGEVVHTFEGHEGSVTALEFSPIGNHLASASEDKTTRIWTLSDGSEREQHKKHNSSPRALRYSQDGSGSRVASGSDSGVAWVWNRNDDTLTRVCPYFCKGTFRISFGIYAAVEMVILATAELGFELDAIGLERAHSLQLSFARFTDGTRSGLPPEWDVAEVEAGLRTLMDINVPLNVVGGQRVQQIRTRKFIEAEKRALGIYISLALRAGPQPDDFLVRRGSVTGAINFLGDETIAVATSPGLFALLGPDFKFGQAEESSPGSGEYNYPLRKNPLDPLSKKVGKIYSVTVGHQQTFSIPPASGILAQLYVEYYTDLLNPDLTISLTIKPVVQSDKTVKWVTDVDVDADLLSRVAQAVYSLGTLSIAGVFGAFLFVDLVVDPAVEFYAEGEVDRDRLARMLDAIPFHLSVADRSWDPFFDTIHTVSALLEEDPVIDERGFAFSAPAVWLDRKQRLHTDRVIRDERRTGGELTGMLFRVAEYDKHKENYEREQPAPGTDRLPFTKPDDIGEPDMVGLTFEQFAERRGSHRIYGPQWLVPKRVHLVFNQIEQLLCVTWLEIEELRRTLGNDAASGALENEIARILRLDLPPEEMYKLQQAGVISMPGTQVVRRQRDDGEFTYYFRDKPDEETSDNLLSLPHYTPPYVPPA